MCYDLAVLCSKKENQIKAYSSILNFLDTYLKDEVAAPIQDGALDQPKINP